MSRDIARGRKSLIGRDRDEKERDANQTVVQHRPLGGEMTSVSRNTGGKRDTLDQGVAKDNSGIAGGRSSVNVTTISDHVRTAPTEEIEANKPKSRTTQTSSSLWSHSNT